MSTNDINDARNLLASAASVVVVTGAGISTASGIPDFRGPGGLWTKDPAAEASSHIDTYVSSPAVRQASWARLRALRHAPPRPNAAHLALAGFERSGRLLLLVTQNTDGLHLTAGNSPERVVEIHGHVRSVRCLSCGAVTTTGAVIERTLFSDPRCRQVIRGSVCDGILKTAVVSFGESLDPVQYHRAERALLNADLLVCVGSTLSVYPIADILGVAVRALPGRLIILNDQPTSFDSRAAVVLSGDITTTLPALLDDQAN